MLEVAEREASTARPALRRDSAAVFMSPAPPERSARSTTGEAGEGRDSSSSSDSDGDEEAVPQEIVGHRMVRRGGTEYKEYQVVWEDGRRTWQSIDLSDAAFGQVMRAFDATSQGQPRSEGAGGQRH